MTDVATFAGIDVGGERKGFDVAVVDDSGELRCHRRGLAAEQAYQHHRGETESFGEIAVPKAGCLPRFGRRA